MPIEALAQVQYDELFSLPHYKACPFNPSPERFFQAK